MTRIDAKNRLAVRRLNAVSGHHVVEALYFDVEKRGERLRRDGGQVYWLDELTELLLP